MAEAGGATIAFLQRLAPGAAAQGPAVRAALAPRFAPDGMVDLPLNLSAADDARQPSTTAQGHAAERWPHRPTVAPPAAAVTAAVPRNVPADAAAGAAQPPARAASTQAPSSRHLSMPVEDAPRRLAPSPQLATPAAAVAPAAETASESPLRLDTAHDGTMRAAERPGPLRAAVQRLPAAQRAASAAPLREAALMQRAAAAPAAAPTVVQVTIDRIDVRARGAALAVPAAPRARPAPSVSLGDYLAGRQRGVTP